VCVTQAFRCHLFATAWAVNLDLVGLPAWWRGLFLLGVRLGVLLHAFLLTAEIDADLYDVACFPGDLCTRRLPSVMFSAPRVIDFTQKTPARGVKNSGQDTAHSRPPSSCEDCCGWRIWRRHGVDSGVDFGLERINLPLLSRLSAVPPRHARAFVLVRQSMVGNVHATAWARGALAQDLARRSEFFGHIFLRWDVTVGGRHQTL
jgi:hypothetical protein